MHRVVGGGGGWSCSGATAAVQLLSFHNFGFDISDIKSEMKLKGCGIIPHSITYTPHSSHKRIIFVSEIQMSCISFSATLEALHSELVSQLVGRSEF